MCANQFINADHVGVTKIHRLTYESTDVMQAIFDKGKAVNRWTGQAKMLRSYMEYFGPRTEQLDIYAEDGQVILTSYTEKIVHGKGLEPHEMLILSEAHSLNRSFEAASTNSCHYRRK